MKKQIVAESLPSADESVYDTTPRKPKFEIEGEVEDDDNNDVVEEEVKDFGG